LTIESPSTADDILFFRAASTLTVSRVDCLVSTAATSADVSVLECDANGANCQATAIATGTCGTSNTALPVGNSGITAANWVRVDVTAVSGAPGHVTVCVTAAP
jgi:hypothetical protein